MAQMAYSMLLYLGELLAVRIHAAQSLKSARRYGAKQTVYTFALIWLTAAQAYAALKRKKVYTFHAIQQIPVQNLSALRKILHLKRTA